MQGLNTNNTFWGKSLQHDRQKTLAQSLHMSKKQDTGQTNLFSISVLIEWQTVSPSYIIWKKVQVLSVELAYICHTDRLTYKRIKVRNDRDTNSNSRKKYHFKSELCFCVIFYLWVTLMLCFCLPDSFLSLLPTHLSIWQQCCEHFSLVLINSTKEHFSQRFHPTNFRLKEDELPQMTCLKGVDFFL